MNLVLTGFMGTGKSAVGRHLAKILKASFVDVDAEIEKRAGMTVAELFRTRGEPAFRQWEKAVIAELATTNKTVISTGGGALIEPKNRENLERNGTLVCLTARLDTLLQRLKNDKNRPLLTGENREARLEQLMKNRERLYAQCPFQIATDDRSVDAVAQDILEKILPQWNA